jgi:hypothetical protein
MQTGKRYGFKLVVRNRNNDTGVHLEAWLDKNADGHFTKVTEADDTGWNAQDGASTAAPPRPSRTRRTSSCSGQARWCSSASTTWRPT